MLYRHYCLKSFHLKIIIPAAINITPRSFVQWNWLFSTPNSPRSYAEIICAVIIKITDCAGPSVFIPIITVYVINAPIIPPDKR